jgi:competence protein ComEA
VNLNTADQKTLETLPGIGPEIAKRIIDYRTKHGGFASIEEIINVDRIGPKTFENIKDLITVD